MSAVKLSPAPVDFAPFKSGCGMCNPSTDYKGFGGKKTKKSKKTTKKRSSTTTKKKRVVRRRKMSGGGDGDSEASKSFVLDADFLRKNLGISFSTMSGGGATPLPSAYFKPTDSMGPSSGPLPGYDRSSVGGRKKRTSTKKKKTPSVIRLPPLGGPRRTTGKKKTSSKK